MGVFTDSREIFTRAFDDAAQLNDAVRDCTFNDGEFDFDWRVVQETVSASESDGESIKITDIKFIGLQHELEATPLVDDTITVNGKTYCITVIEPDPADIIWTIYARGY